MGADSGKEGNRLRAVTLSVAFLAGVVVTLVILGTIAAWIGQILREYDVLFTWMIAVISLAAGIVTLLPRRNLPIRVPSWGNAGAFVYGTVYSIAAITTSAGPLMLLLTLSAAVGRPGWGALISFSYAIGRGLPFLLIGTFAGAASRLLSRIRGSQRLIEIISAVALFAAAAYFAWAGMAMMGGPP